MVVVGTLGTVETAGRLRIPLSCAHSNDVSCILLPLCSGLMETLSLSLSNMQGQGTVSSKLNDNYLCGSLLKLVVALCIIIICAYASESGNQT